jgi:hypothetical protein
MKINEKDLVCPNCCVSGKMIYREHCVYINTYETVDIELDAEDLKKIENMDADDECSEVLDYNSTPQMPSDRDCVELINSEYHCRACENWFNSDESDSVNNMILASIRQKRIIELAGLNK